MLIKVDETLYNELAEGFTDPRLGREVLNTGAYSLEFGQVYFGTTPVVEKDGSVVGGGTHFMELNFRNLVTGKEDSHRIYISNNITKGAEFFYTDSKTGNKRPLAGFEMADNLCFAALGKPLVTVLNTSQKEATVKDKDGKDITVGMVADFNGAKALVGIVKQLDAYEKDNTAAEFERNEWVAVFNDKTKCTRAETMKGLTTGVIIDKWTNIHTVDYVAKTKKWHELMGETTNIANVGGAPSEISNGSGPTETPFNI